MKIGIVGATGMVGRIIVDILMKKNFLLYLSASNKSVGKKILFGKRYYKIMKIEDLLLKKPNIVFFSAGSKISKEWGKKFSKKGTTVIDNSSAWRMDKNKKLIVPEINSYLLNKNDKIIANPNCSTIQLVMVLFPLHIKYSISRIVISTYQSVTGTGKKALDQMNKEKLGITCKSKIYPYPIHENVLPHCGDFMENGYSFEEIKLENETKKIINDMSISITSTSVRVPVIGGHSESVNVTFNNKIDIDDIYKILKNTKGVTVMDNIKKNIYPMPIYSHGKDEVFVGRIRKDFSFKNSLNLWIVADNLRKGAATNAVQIMDYLINKNLIEK